MTPIASVDLSRNPGPYKPPAPLSWVLAGKDPPPVLVGDRLLVAVLLSTGNYEYQVIHASETGWDEDYGVPWSAWDWSAVTHFCRLDPIRPEEQP